MYHDTFNKNAYVASQGITWSHEPMTKNEHKY